jgi:hypothetical protein
MKVVNLRLAMVKTRATWFWQECGEITLSNTGHQSGK